jgi:hypothetical protein
MFACSNFYFRLQLRLIIIHITCISLSLCRTSAPIHLTSVLGVLGTQETSCILIARLLERDTFDQFLPKFDKPWVVHLRETCCCSTNLCTWRPNTVYKNRSVRRHHRPWEEISRKTYVQHVWAYWWRCRRRVYNGGSEAKPKGTHPLMRALYSYATQPLKSWEIDLWSR